MPICIFSGAQDNDAFKGWIEANFKEGHYLNVVSPISGVIHAARCTHVKPQTFSGRVHTNVTKITSLSVDDLRTYAAEHDIELENCDLKKICPQT